MRAGTLAETERPDNGVAIEYYEDHRTLLYCVEAAGVLIFATRGRDKARGVFDFLSALEAEPLTALIEHARAQLVASGG